MTCTEPLDLFLRVLAVGGGFVLVMGAALLMFWGMFYIIDGRG